MFSNDIIFDTCKPQTCFLVVSIYAWCQSHFREVPRWEIFVEQELRFGLGLGRLELLKKQTFGPIMSNFLGRFFSCFHWQKNKN